MQIHLLFTLPELDNSGAICTIEQLVPVSYQANGLCFSGPITRQDLLLLPCAEKMYIVKQAELEQCSQEASTILCPANVLSTVEDPVWLGLKWIPNSKLLFNQLTIISSPRRSILFAYCPNKFIAYFEQCVPYG